MARDAAEETTIQTFGGKSRTTASIQVFSRLLLQLPTKLDITDLLDPAFHLLAQANLFGIVEKSPTQVLLVERDEERAARQIPFLIKVANGVMHPISFLAGRARTNEFGFECYELAAALGRALTDQTFAADIRAANSTGDYDTWQALAYLAKGDSILMSNVLFPNGPQWLAPCETGSGSWFNSGVSMEPLSFHNGRFVGNYVSRSFRRIRL